MSFPRFALLVLPVALALPLLTGGCGAPLAVTAASYGADGASYVGTGKTGSDHFISMVSQEDCALWRAFRNQDVCRARNGDHDPYNVNYNEPFRQASEGGVEYTPPPQAPADAPSTSWEATAYAGPTTVPSVDTPASSTAGKDAVGKTPPAAQTATATPERPAVESPPVKVKKHLIRHATAKRKRLKKKPAPGRAETDL